MIWALTAYLATGLLLAEFVINRCRRKQQLSDDIEPCWTWLVILLLWPVIGVAATVRYWMQRREV